MSRKPTIPLAVYVLAIAIFAQGTSELMLSGLLPTIASDLNVSIPQAGWLTSGFAIGMAIGAPVLTVLTLRWPRLRSLLVFLGVFIAMHAIGALIPRYEVLLATRVIGAFAYAGFWALAAVVAVQLVAASAKGKALAVMAGGLTVATVIGVPAGTFIGQQLGWQATMWTVAGFSLLSVIGILATVPGGHTDAANLPRLSREAEVIRNRRLWLSYVLTAMSSGHGVAIMTYLGALLISVTAVSAAWVPIVLVLFGIGSMVGIAIGGRYADANPFTTLAIGFGGAAVIALLLGYFATVPIAAIALVTLLPVFGFATNPAVNVRVFTLAGNAPTLAAAANITGFNVGIMIAPALGGALIAGGFGIVAVTWVGAGLALFGLSATGLAYALRHKDIEVPQLEPAAAA